MIATWGVGACGITLLSFDSVAIALPQSLSTRRQHSETPSVSMAYLTKQSGSAGTSQTQDNLLNFETTRYWVRVYRQNGQLYMNLFDKQEQALTFNQVPTSIAPGSENNWRTYISTFGEVQAYARRSPNGSTELELFLDGQQTYFSSGLDPSNGSNPSDSDDNSPNTGVIAQPPPNTDQLLETILAFDTDDYAVRVYRQNGQLYMNLFDKRVAELLLQEAPATVVPSSGAGNTGQSYVNTEGEFQAFARIAQNRSTELEIRSNGVLTYRADGYNTSGTMTALSVTPANEGYIGNDFSVPAQARITGNIVNLRRQPSTSAAIVTTVPQCIIVNVVQRVRNDSDRYIWYQIEGTGQVEGWIRGDLLSVGQTSCGF